MPVGPWTPQIATRSARFGVQRPSGAGHRSCFSTDPGTRGSNRVPGRVVLWPHAHEGRAPW
ncbi:hypothetical protein E6W17_12275 [Streptomyces sp. A1547]|nr:hypothetical protein E6W17_12275 [Streptomyces sp. A1547]